MLDLNDELDHHGVKGMRWGRRKKPSRNDNYNKQYLNETPGAIKTKVKTKRGETLTIEKVPLAGLSATVNRKLNRKPGQLAASMHISDSNGNKVGSFQVWREDKHTARGEWLSISKDRQGQGYSEAAIRGLIQASKKDRMITTIRLQVPSTSDAAKHIYSKIGFVPDTDHQNFESFGIEEWVYRLNK